MTNQLAGLLDIVTFVVTSLVSLSPVIWLLGSIIVCACAVLTIRLLYWR